ncbi:hypothetical protein LOK49_LG01G02083 [Camellia lanceoleosa]|uniref:Uncharacterized protein n=1 Tax=Camellia lanceoleosa TaxID=1840588 RepID=A0ACC0J157_9ERIC|nr:hypothetical protein LOK49_LG01G02083 [Camellia lanceoleosa]
MAKADLMQSFELGAMEDSKGKKLQRERTRISKCRSEAKERETNVFVKSEAAAKQQ